MANEFKPGSIVPFSGIYRVVHDTKHAEPHDVTCIKGEHFPSCGTCKHPRFILKKKAQHVEDNRSLKQT